MASVDDPTEKSYIAIEFENSEAALSFLEKVQKVLENTNKRNPTFKLARFWLALKPKLPGINFFRRLQ